MTPLIILMGMPAPGEWLLIAIVLFVLFGVNKIPDVAKTIGKGVREFRDIENDVKKEVDDVKKDIPKI